MFDFDSFREIWSTIRKNKMRTFLTGFAVAWGIFMLIILIAAGNGLKNGVMSNFAFRAKNAVKVWPGTTSMSYKGLPSNRSIRFDHRDLEMLKTKIPEIEYVSAGMGRQVILSYGQEYLSVELEGMTDQGAYINNISVDGTDGRFINVPDVESRRKVIVLHPDHQKVLFKQEDPIGKYVLADNIAYQVIGLYSAKSRRQNPSAYIPLTTAQMLYNRGYGYRHLEFTINGPKTIEENDAFIERLREHMGNLHTFNPTDRSSMYVRNSAKDSIETEQIFSMLSLFIIIVGIASLMAGIVGVGNIMLITVKERTREIGIRKALGAPPNSIIWLVIFEAMFITTCAGYFGILLGVGITEYLNVQMDAVAATGEATIFLNPTVDLGAVIWATVLLIISGMVAGAIPAYKAAKVSPIESMRAE